MTRPCLARAGALAVFLLVVPSLAPPPARSQTPAGGAASAAPSLTDSLRLDPLVRTGVLDNGLRWYVRPNARPEKRVSLRLALAVGSTAERGDQRGLAHFAEHMNFNGSAHFKPEEMVAYLESIGLRFGGDANGYTSFDETVYRLDVPTDRDTLLDRGLMALSDFAGRATLSDVEIEKERGVVLEEWRLGLGAEDRVWRRQMPVLYHGSHYAERMPIGLPDVIRKAPAARLRDFYRTWYTPDRMALVVVGDVDAARIDSLIRVHFGGLARPARSPARPLFAIPIHQETLVSVATDKELTLAHVQILFKRPRQETRTVADARAGLVRELYASMLNARLAELGHRADAPYLWAGAYSGALGRTLETWNVYAVVRDIGRSLTILSQESARVRRHGFLPSELSRAREELRASDERAWAERDKTESPALAQACVGSFLVGSPAIGTAARHALVRAQLDGITLEEVNALSPRLMPGAGRVVTVASPPGPDVPTEAGVRRLLAAAEGAPLPAWQDEIAGTALMPNPPAPGRVTARRELPEIGVTVLSLSNGAEAWLKPTDFKADEILFGAQARGGGSTADSALYLAAVLSPVFVARCGVGGFTATDLQKLTAGKIVTAGTFVNDYRHGLNGSARPADLETGLQLAYLDFTHPTRDSASFAGLIEGFRKFLDERANQPDSWLQDTLIAVNSGNFYMDRVPTAADLGAVRLDDALEFHRRLFANAADFTFFLVGAFQVDSVVPLLERTLAALPSAGHPTTDLVARGPRYPDHVRRAIVRRGTEPKSGTTITFFVNDGLEELDLHRARSCASILRDHLRRSLREMLSGTYGASAAFSYREPLPGYATMTIEFGCAPERVDSMVAAALREVRALREEGPSEADLQREQEMQRRELEVGLKENSYWLGALQVMQRLGWDPRRIAKRRERIDALTVADLKETFRKYFPLERYTVVTLLPEAGGGAAKR